jgi:hypothetical protein
MARPRLYDPFRLILAGLGCASLLFGIFIGGFYCMRWKTAAGVVKSLEVVQRGKTNTVLGVDYTRSNGVQTSVPFAEESLPALARAGDHLTVIYDPEGKSAMVYTFRSVWRTPTLAAVIGVVLAGFGWFFPPRNKGNH